jgi:hypothetical protein
MSTSSVCRESSREEKQETKTRSNRRMAARYQDLVASISLVALSTTVLTLVYESMVP